MRQKISKGLIVFIIIGIVILLSAIGGFIYLYNLTSETAALRQQKDSELKIAVGKIERSPQIEEELAQLRAEEIRLDKFVPDKEGQDEFIWQLEELADQSKITIASCNIEKESKDYKDLTGFKVYQWNVKIRGDYKGLYNFLKILPESKRGVMVSMIKINSLVDNEKVKKNYLLEVELILDLITSSGEKVKK